MKLYRTASGFIVERHDRFYVAENPSWDELIVHQDLHAQLAKVVEQQKPISASSFADIETLLVAPIGTQEVWASGVTYYRSRNARMEEAKTAGGGDFYDRVYHAERPELFMKATPNRVVGHRGKVAIRKDAHWSVPEPELTLVANPGGKIVGYTIGNDMSSRDIEGENPLYLPQAKVYDRACALGPGILVSSETLPPSTEIQMEILRAGKKVFSGSTALTELKRTFTTLLEYLYRDNSFPTGCFLLTGTGIVPPDEFTLQQQDEIRITITGIGTLINTVG
ncbi:MAG TPA: fumarylacetoacetate hydrolase family protein [Acidobacteriaceae bacterium]|nr:fumarylacetoacetate hydrolase family protein [Acidobacteriaceae bacterium]